MATFDEHINQTLKNLDFLSLVNQHGQGGTFIDWQITTCFYAAVHLINSHLAKSNLHPRTHKEVEKCINVAGPFIQCRLPAAEFSAYQKLSQLSRTSRYLVDTTNGNVTATYSREKNLFTSIKQLDLLMTYFHKNHQIPFPVSEIQFSLPLIYTGLSFFKKAV